MNKFKLALVMIIALLIIILGVLAAIVSTGLSIAYFTTLTGDETLQLVVVGFIVLLQTMVLLGAMVKSVVYNRTPQHYTMVVWFTRLCFIVSVLSNITFFNAFDKHQRILVIQELLNIIPFAQLDDNIWLVSSLTNATLVWISCIVLDLMGMYFPSIGFDLITGVSTYDNKRKDYIGKIWSLIMYKPRRFIDDKCLEYGIINLETKKELDTKPKLPVPKMSNLLNRDYTRKLDTNTETNILDTDIPDTKTSNLDTNTETSILDTNTETNNQDTNIPDTKTNNLDTDIPDTKTNNQDTNIPDTKTNNLDTNTDTNTETDIPDTKTNNLDTLVKKIDGYIVKNYVSGTKINVTELKNIYGFKKHDRKWNDKIRPYLTSAYINPENKRLTRQ